MPAVPFSGTEPMGSLVSPWGQDIPCHTADDNGNNNNFQSINNMPGEMPGPWGHVILNPY